MDIVDFEASKRSISLRQGEIAFADIGDGPAALFVHGVFMNGLLWRNVIEDVADRRRCLAIDLPAHGNTRMGSDASFSLESHAQLLADFLDALEIDRVDLVGNDTGGAISQMFAVRYPDRMRTLTLTNCDVHENFPPDAFAPAIELAREGQLAPVVAAMTSDLDLARSEMGLGVGFEHPETITEEIVRAYLGRYESPEAGQEIERRIASVAEGGLEEIAPLLKKMQIPTLVVWGTADKFFDVAWAYWLRDNIPGVTEVVEIEGAKLFFPEERGSELAEHLKRHWSRHPTSDEVLSSSATKEV